MILQAYGVVISDFFSILKTTIQSKYKIWLGFERANGVCSAAAFLRLLCLALGPVHPVGGKVATALSASDYESHTVSLGSSELPQPLFKLIFCAPIVDKELENHWRTCQNKSLCPICVDDGYYTAAWKHCFHSRETTWGKSPWEAGTCDCSARIALYTESAFKMSPFILSSRTTGPIVGMFTASAQEPSAPLLPVNLCCWVGPF